MSEDLFKHLKEYACIDCPFSTNADVWDGNYFSSVPFCSYVGRVSMHRNGCEREPTIIDEMNDGLPPKGKKGDSTMEIENTVTMETVENTETVEATVKTTSGPDEITIDGVAYVKRELCEKNVKTLMDAHTRVQAADRKTIEEMEAALEDQAELIDELRDAKEMKAADELAGMKYCIVWGRNSGIFAGYVEEDDGEYVKLRRARYIQQLSGACGLNQFAKYGTKEPQNCQITVEVDNARITDATIIIECTETARQNILRIPDWKV